MAAPVAAAAPVLQYAGVRKSFSAGRAVLDGFSLAVAPGETVALVGPSGCGKTTALKLANRLLEPEAGMVSVFGRPAAEHDPVALRRRIGWVIQEGGLFPHWTVRENVEAVPRLLGWPEPQRRARAAQLLETVGLPAASYSERRPSGLSGGQRQRVGVARALAARPALVLMDEPFGALDPISRRAMQAEFRAWKKDWNAAVVLVTHDLREAFRLAERVAVLEGGRLHQVGSREELTRAPADAFVREFVAEFGE